MLVTDPLAVLPDLLEWPTETLDRVIAELADPAHHPTPAHRLARAWALGIRFDRDHDPATLAAALADYAASTYRGPQRGGVGRYLALRRLLAGFLGQPVDLPAVRAMVAEAGDDPTMPGSAALILAMTDVMAAYADEPGYDHAESLRRLDELAETIPPENELRAVLPSLRMALAVKRGTERGNYSDATAAAEHARGLLESGELDPARRAAAEAMLAGAEGMAAAQRGELDQASAQMLALTDAVAQMPAGPQATAMRRLLAGATGQASEEDADEAGLAAGERAWRLLMSAMGILQPALDAKDAAAVGRGIRILREAAEVAPADYRHRALILSMLGQMLTIQSQLDTAGPSALGFGGPSAPGFGGPSGAGFGGGRPVLDEAIRRLTDAQRAAGHPGHPIWAPTLMSLGMAYRVAGRAVLSRETGRRALRGHAWSVLLQAGTEDAASAARDAADNAKQVARWCLEDGDPVGAVSALDAGRCLMLYATTVTMDIPARLDGLGRPDLLERWMRDPTDPEVRADVLAALTGGELTDASVPDVLDPPPLDEIAPALTRLRADALVYLLPADDQGPGYAVLVPADGRRPTHLSLPSLTTTGPVAHHLTQLDTRAATAQPHAHDAAPSTPHPHAHDAPP
ncbi:hypothetical protein AB0J83_30035 [Actinoplanes sp. NPDC049596]|uniref:hypothetical protein n=1 Tax=Actinoplanes sp. NPDC049596 TaxID=3154625 RepID=UPI00343B1DED